MVEWESGEVTYEPLTLISKDDPMTCAVYAKKQDLLDTTGWKHLKRYAKTSKRLIRAVKQSRIRQVRASARYQHDFEQWIMRSQELEWFWYGSQCAILCQVSVAIATTTTSSRSRPPKIVGRLTDQVEIIQPPSGLSVLLLCPVCVSPLLFTKEKHRRVPSPNAELTEFSFVCHALFLKRFACMTLPLLLSSCWLNW